MGRSPDSARRKEGGVGGRKEGGKREKRGRKEGKGYKSRWRRAKDRLEEGMRREEGESVLTATARVLNCESDREPRGERLWKSQESNIDSA